MSCGGEGVGHVVTLGQAPALFNPWLTMRMKWCRIIRFSIHPGRSGGFWVGREEEGGWIRTFSSSVFHLPVLVAASASTLRLWCHPPPSPFSIHRLISECNKLFMYLRWWYQLRLLLIKMGCVSVISWLIQSFVGELIECLIVIVSKRRGRAIAGRFRSCWVINLVSLLDIPIQGRSGAVSDRFQTGFRAVQEEMCAVDYQEISEQL